MNIEDVVAGNWTPHVVTFRAPTRPRIVCICGSTRFASQMNDLAQKLTLEGRIVVRPEVVAYDSEKDEQFVDPAAKERLDELHLRKIDLCDEVWVVNTGYYIGKSTRREIEYASALGRPIHYTQPQ